MTKPTLAVGQTCWYYARGDTKREPRAAIVTAVLNPGMLTLAVFNPNSRALDLADGVIHKDDPLIQQNPQRAYTSGVWDYIHGHYCELLGKPPAQPPKRGPGRPRKHPSSKSGSAV